jgi:hypothetical protein
MSKIAARHQRSNLQQHERTMAIKSALSIAFAFSLALPCLGQGESKEKPTELEGKGQRTKWKTDAAENVHHPKRS